MPSTPSLFQWATVWLIAASFLVFRHWRPARGVGIVLGYVVSFGAIHWLAPALNLLPWNENRQQDVLALGMEQSALAMVMFVVGSEATLLVRRRRWGGETAPGAQGVTLNHAAVNGYLVTGLVLHLVFFPLARGLPSIATLVSTGSTFVVTAVSLKCWNAWHEGQSGRILMWLLASAILPFFTVATQGYLGYGLAAMLTVVAFVAAIYGIEWRITAVAVVFAYLGMSLYVTYMRDRDTIRSVVWGGSRLDERVASVTNTLTEFEWFDPHEKRHLDRIEVRLNQNILVGAAVRRSASGMTPPAHGETIVDAAFALIPRMFWPEKTIVAGSGDLVSIYTGIKFGKDTSVGIGQVLEFYVNFGTLGVLIGFVVLGAVTTLADGAALRALNEGNIQRFTLWYLPGLSALNVGGSFVEATSTAAASLAMATLVGFWMKRLPGHSLALVLPPSTSRSSEVEP